jgi:hypothetical protein
MNVAVFTKPVAAQPADPQPRRITCLNRAATAALCKAFWLLAFAPTVTNGFEDRHLAGERFFNRARRLIGGCYSQSRTMNDCPRHQLCLSREPRHRCVRDECR